MKINNNNEKIIIINNNKNYTQKLELKTVSNVCV